MATRSGASGNEDEIERLLGELAEAFDFTRPGAEGSLGEDLLDLYAERVYERTVGEGKDASGGEIEPNRGRYGERKRAGGLPVGIGTDARGSDSMLSLVQLKGERSISPDLATVVYGTSPFARDKAAWFTHGSEGPEGERSGAEGERSGAEGQPPRPFWGLDEELEREFVARCDTHLVGVLKSLGG